MEWRPIHGFEGYYEISDEGSVRGLTRTLSDGRLHRGAPLAVKTSKSGHKSVRLCKAGAHHWKGVHCLVLEAFVGPCPDGMEGAHNSGDATDNRLANLRWDTRKGNHADKRLHGTMAEGARNGNSKLTQSDVDQIFGFRQEGENLSRIAARFGVTAANISSILSGKTWKSGGRPNADI